MKKVLVLGATGMLGSMVRDYLRRNGALEVRGTYREPLPFFDQNEYRFNARNAEEELPSVLQDFSPDYLVNAIGIINRYCRDDDASGVQNAVHINALFPFILQRLVAQYTPNAKIIQIATDCVFSGRTGYYDEFAPHDAYDVYGKTKSIGEVQAENMLNIRCSIIGPEIKGKVSLLEWFLSQKDGSEVPGFSHHQWNGVTTLQFAQLVEDIVENDRFPFFSQWKRTIHYTPNTSVSKYELLRMFADIFQKPVTVKKVDTVGQPKNMTIRNTLFSQTQNDMNDAVVSLREYIDESEVF